jgi:hypothetical protein
MMHANIPLDICSFMSLWKLFLYAYVFLEWQTHLLLLLLQDLLQIFRKYLIGK